MHAEGKPILAEWTSAELHKLVAHFLRSRFPVLVGFNKCDDDRSKAHLGRVRATYPNEVVVAMSAHAELVMLANDGVVGAPKKKAGDDALLSSAVAALGGTTGVK